MIFDCFMFFNELDVLEIRLNVLNEYVDKFVLVECTKTHTGKEKPLYFHENKNRYADFLHKIIHVVVDDMPKYNGSNSWELENFHRNAIVRGLKEAKENDVVLISDVDEIPRPEKIALYSHIDGLKIFQQHMFYYYLNCLNTDVKWYGTIMLKFPFKRSIQFYRTNSHVFSNIYDKNKIRALYYYLKILRFRFFEENVMIIKDGGWHFSYMGGLDAIVRKIEAFAHTEYNKDEYKDLSYLKAKIEAGEDIFGRSYKYQFVETDTILPQYINENKEKYEYMIFKKKDHQL